MADWIRVADVSDCGGNSCLRAVMGDGQEIVLVKWDGGFYALEDRCSHQDYPLSDGELEDGELECIYHGARFDVKTGRALQLPAIRPVRSYPVEVRGEEIFVDVS